MTRQSHASNCDVNHDVSISCSEALRIAQPFEREGAPEIVHVDPSPVMLGVPKDLQPIRVYAVTDTDWFAGADAQSCADLYLNQYGGDKESQDVYGVPVALTDVDLERLQFHDLEESMPTARSFREELDRLIAAGTEFPAFFATTEY